MPLARGMVPVRAEDFERKVDRDRKKMQEQGHQEQPAATDPSEADDSDSVPF